MKSKTPLIGLLLLSLSACSSQHQAPTMLDYSYVPPVKAAPSTQNYGIDDF